MSKYKAEYKVHFILLLFCLSINFAGSHVAFENSYRFLYLDMIGTFIAAVLYGPLGGLIVGALTNCLLSFKAAHFWYFTPENIIGGIYWGWLTDKGGLSISNYSSTKFGVKAILFAGICGGIVCSVPGGVIQRFIFDDTTYSYSSYVTKVMKDYFNDKSFLYNILADITLSVPDKVLTVLLGLLVIVTILRFFSIRLTHIQQSYNSRIEFKDNNELILLSVVSLCMYYIIPYLCDINLYYRMSSFPMIILHLSPLCYLIYRCVVNVSENANSNKYFDLYKNNRFKHLALKPRYRDFIIYATLAALTYPALFIYLNKWPVQYFTELNQKPNPSIMVVIFLLLLFITYFFIDDYNTSHYASLEVERERKEKNKFELFYQKIMNDVEQTALQQKQHLQVLEFNSRTMVKEVVHNHTLKLDEIMQSKANEVLHAFGNSIDSILHNKESDAIEDAVTDNIYENIITPYQNKILGALRNLPKMFDLSTEEVSIPSLYGIFREYIISEYPDKSNVIEFKNLPSIFTDNDVVAINTLGLLSILNDLITNSSTALTKKNIASRKSGGGKFAGVITISFEKSVTGNNEYLLISVKDNAGGFPDDILREVYKNPVRSSKQPERFGGGTNYISLSMKLMGGDVEGANYDFDGQSQGAMTKLSFAIRCVN